MSTMILRRKHCVPCEGGMAPLTHGEETRMGKEVPGWKPERGKIHKLRREFTFKDFKQAMKFVNRVARLAEREGHHPNLFIFYRRVECELFTHALHGLSENDFILAAKINALKS
ncbi:MAG: 4a-hydroxytetrahydrobiopterin dehydratase [Candidatus Diapherotrites archaeon]|nr:4a-hydroxytetrahydrobiopterin dehydratase [Candidatus Diapherotrites archaeon]